MTAKLKNLKVKVPQRRTEPVWKGPSEDGVTQSLLARFLSCRERFRLLVVEGLKPADNFEPRIEFGNMWHVCEESLAGEEKHFIDNYLREYCQGLCKRFPLKQDQIDHWYNICRELFPLYYEHWKNHDDVKNRTPLMQEQEFNVPYMLPSGRIVRLRGKWDSVDLIGKGIYIQENKTKSSIDVVKLNRQLRFDLQTMFYLIAFQGCRESKFKGFASMGERIAVLTADRPLLGVRYNVIRRSSHKSVDSMLKKIEDDRKAGRIGEWFARWKVEVSPQDIARFRKQFLDPVLEELCNWWSFITSGADPFTTSGDADEVHHWRHPYGIYNPMDEGGSSELDHYIDSGDEIGLQRTDNLFPELPGTAE